MRRRMAAAAGSGAGSGGGASAPPSAALPPAHAPKPAAPALPPPPPLPSAQGGIVRSSGAAFSMAIGATKPAPAAGTGKVAFSLGAKPGKVSFGFNQKR